MTYPVYPLILLVRLEVSEAALCEGVAVEDHVTVRGLAVQLSPGRRRDKLQDNGASRHVDSPQEEEGEREEGVGSTPLAEGQVGYMEMEMRDTRKWENGEIGKKIVQGMQMSMEVA